MRRTDFCTREDLAKEFGISKQAIEQRLKKLKIKPIDPTRIPYLYSRVALKKALEESKPKQRTAKICAAIKCWKSKSSNMSYSLSEYASIIGISKTYLQMFVRQAKIAPDNLSQRNVGYTYAEFKFYSALEKFINSKIQRDKVNL